MKYVNALLGLGALAGAAHAASPFNWTALPSSTNLTRTPCYDIFQCAKLTVPLQYSDPSAGEAEIAFVISPSNFSSDNPSYRGPIFFNPGGPGDPGSSFVLSLAPYLRAVIGPAYDLVGFDPRGIGFSTPSLSLFPDLAQAVAYFGTYPADVEAEPDAFARAYAWGQVYSGIAEQKALAGEKVWESVGTAAVVQDILAIAKAFGSDVVNYWGYSYGTTLGATFAAMFPDNVGRIILDGVMNAHEYYDGHDHSSLLRASGALTSIYDGCVAAGPTYCALWSPNATAVRARVDALLDSLSSTPLPVPPSANISVGGLVDRTVLTSSLFTTLYFPYQLGAGFMAALAALEAGDPAPLWTFSLDIGVTIAPFATCSLILGGPALQLDFLDTRTPVACGDSAGRARATLGEAKENYGILKKEAGFLAGMWWPALPGPCTTWNITAKDQFNASFYTSTKNPLLLISNTFDPVTPIQSGQNMSSGFKGSVLLEQNSTGHSSLSGFSTCTALAIRAYFANGTLPAPHTLCQMDTAMFIDPTNSSANGGVTVSLPSRRAVFDRSPLGELEMREFAEAVKGLREEGSRLLRRTAFAGKMKQVRAWGQQMF